MTLYAYLLKERANNIALQLASIFIATLVIAVSAKIKIPFYPVPMTMQTAAIIGLALAFGMKRGSLIVGLYLLEGAVGLPVFAGTPERGIGLSYIAGPTGGYLAGYFVAAVVCGFLADRGWSGSVPLAFAAAIIGTVVIFIPGLLWLGVLFGWKMSLLEGGLYPFLWGALFKALLVAFVIGGAWRIARKS